VEQADPLCPASGLHQSRTGRKSTARINHMPMMEGRAIYAPEYEELRRSVRRFFESELLPNIAQWEEDGIIPKSLWLKAGEMGILCPTVSEEYGGFGGDFLHLSIIDEELGYTGQASFTIQTHTDIVAAYVEALGAEEQKQRWLPR